MFNDPWSQERFIVGIQAFMFSALSDPVNFKRQLVGLGKSHAAKGVKAVEYGIIGEVSNSLCAIFSSSHGSVFVISYQVFFWSLQRCLGPFYTDQTHLAWRKLFSAMLVVLVPVAVGCEQMYGHEAQNIRQQCKYSSYSWKDSQDMKNASDKRYKNTHPQRNESGETIPLYHAASDQNPIFKEEVC
jgi:hypothetical protein